MFSIFKKKADGSETHQPVERLPHSNTIPSKAAPEKLSWFSRLRKGLSKTGSNLSNVFLRRAIDEELYEEIEAALLMADVGVVATNHLLSELQKQAKQKKVPDAAQLKILLADLMTEHLLCLQRQIEFTAAPLVMMVAGINGAGKTTTIGKLAYYFQEQKKSVVLAAGDTFRAAAQEQLKAWGDKNNIHVISQEKGDPASVAFDAVQSGVSKNNDVVMVDTAGRLPTQIHLMEEVKKIKRVIGKAKADAPHEVILVVDGNNGQNALAQIKAFDDAIGLTGLVVTKLDGTAKGGIIAAIAAGAGGVPKIPVYWIGVGEQVEDLQLFNAKEFAYALLDLEIEH